MPPLGKTIEDEVQATDSITLPEKPLRLVSLRLDEEDPTARKVRVDGVTVRLKSRTVT
jgi:hypothetical protein